MKVDLFLLAAALLAFPQLNHAQDTDQARCSHLVERNLSTTQKESPDIYATIGNHFSEWSPSHSACVMIIEYKVKPIAAAPYLRVQILAVNAVTMEPMEAYRNVFLLPADKSAAIEKAVDFLFDRYQK